VVSVAAVYALVESRPIRVLVYRGPSALGAKIGQSMILRLLLLIVGLACIYASLTVMQVHLYVTLLLLFLCAGPLSYFVFREEHE
jgi:Ca2+/Na+ antiporter